ncbi:MAG: fimbrial assembly protein FimA [Desulfurococcales archaeon ex4484_217_1]|nr:MAG: fimbrial assembly protein FimA [Desulfurococcales archaeon ex4484_217_2]OYT60773.1 MAG: fimbrial assembly protein FimA [Desulfurococcales archaeon ex4484_217_1]
MLKKVLTTFSIVGYDPETKDLGVAVASKFIAVGAIVPWAKANVGAIATQALANVSYGPKGLELLSKGYGAKKVVEILVSNDPLRDERQVGIVDFKGEAAAFTGRKCFEYAGHIVGDGYAVQGNILTGPEVLEEMAKAFETTKGELVDKLLAALEAGDRAGGDRRGKQSAAILVVREKGGYGGYTDRYVDLRVDDHKEPVLELKRLFKIWELTLLTREKPDDIVSKDEVAAEIQKALRKLGFYRGEITGKWDDVTEKAFTDWVMINNFENKLRKDRYIWGTVYRFLIETSGSSEK